MEDELWQVQRDANKALGDSAFRSGQYADAIHHYTTALTLDPTHHVLLSNRSAAFLKQNATSKALHDAQACVNAAPSTFVKGHSRLGAALQALGRWGPAKEAYEHVLRLDKGNAAATQGVQDCEKKLQQLVQIQQQEQEQEQQVQQESKPKDETDLLDDFFDELETVTAAKPTATTDEVVGTTTTSLLTIHKKDLGTAQSQSQRLLEKNYKWRNLNPFYVLDLPPTATKDDIGRRYKALSLLLHPDKCSLPPEAYDEVQRAKKQLLDDDDKLRHVRALADEGMKAGATLFQKQSKSMTTMNTVTLSLEELQTRETLRIFAEVEMKRKEVEERERKYEQRERDQEESELHKEKKERAFDKSWRQEERVGKRVGNWRDFEKKAKKKSKI